MKELSLDEYKHLILSILIRIDHICRENNLTYFLYGGTLLGAIRHGGFIPWDDDLDIVMKRDDYSKLQEIINSQDYGLVFITPENSDDTIYPFGKVCDTSTCLIEKNFRPVVGYGAFVDVFPLHYVADMPPVRWIECKYFDAFNRVVTHSSRICYEKTDSRLRTFARSVAFRVFRLLDYKKLVHMLDLQLRSVCSRPTGYIGVPWGIIFPAELYDGVCEVAFEGFSVMAPADPDAVLRIAFGDYMTLPPIEQRRQKHSLACFSLRVDD